MAKVHKLNLKKIDINFIAKHPQNQKKDFWFDTANEELEHIQLFGEDNNNTYVLIDVSYKRVLDQEDLKQEIICSSKNMSSSLHYYKFGLETICIFIKSFGGERE